MKTHIAAALLAVIFSTAGLAQDNRGDTDYTNNRDKQKTEQNQKPQVNTKQETPVKIIQYIPGTWTVDQVTRGNNEVSANDTTSQNEMLVFNREGRYMSYSGNELIDSGAYRINEDHAILYMSSESSENTSEWSVWFGDDGTMTLKLKDGVKHGERYVYTYRRTDDARRDND